MRKIANFARKSLQLTPKEVGDRSIVGSCNRDVGCWMSQGRQIIIDNMATAGTAGEGGCYYEFTSVIMNLPLF